MPPHYDNVTSLRCYGDRGGGLRDEFRVLPGTSPGDRGHGFVTGEDAWAMWSHGPVVAEKSGFLMLGLGNHGFQIWISVRFKYV